MSHRETFLKEAIDRWGRNISLEMREDLEKTADAVEIVDSYKLGPMDEPASKFEVGSY